MDQNVMNALNEAGEALKALGDVAVSMHCYGGDSFHIILCGMKGQIGTGKTPAEAYADAVVKRDAVREQQVLEAEVRAEIERRRAAEREAA